MKPITFNANEIRAIQDGRKTQFRKPLEPQPKFKRKLPGIGYLSKTWSEHDDEWGLYLEAWPSLGSWGLVSDLHKCPYGKPGDLLWVQEEWSAETSHSCGEGECECEEFYIQYEGGVERYNLNYPEGWGFDENRTYPPSSMRKWQSRITLENTGVRVEKVHEISLKDILAEGCPKGLGGTKDGTEPWDWFFDVWDGIYIDKGLDIGSEPLIWVLEFKVKQ